MNSEIIIALYFISEWRISKSHTSVVSTYWNSPSQGAYGGHFAVHESFKPSKIKLMHLFLQSRMSYTKQPEVKPRRHELFHRV